MDVEADASVIGRTGVSTAGLYVLGLLTIAGFLKITTVPEIRLQCVTVQMPSPTSSRRKKRAVALYRRGTASGSVR